MSKVEVLKSFEDLSVLFGLRVETPEVEPEIGWYAYKVVGFTAKYDGVIHKDYTDEEAQEIVSSLGYRVVLVDVRNKTYKAGDVKLFINGVEMKGLLNCITLGEEKEKADMECYIRDYKHLIGCVVNLESDDLQIVGSWRCGVQIKDVGDVHILNTLFKDVKFYQSDEDESLVDYRTYMKTYYPEYKHIWQEQL